MRVPRCLLPMAAGLACLLAAPAACQTAETPETARISDTPYTPDWDAICAEGAAIGEGCDAIRAREIADSAAPPWRAIGRVNFASTRVRAHCTGTLVGERVVVTAAHCLYNRMRKSWIPARSTLFAAGYQRGGYQAVSRVARYVLDPVHDPDGREFKGGPARDWAILILEDPIGRETGFVPLAAVTADALWTAELIFAGYPALRKHVLSVERDCGGAEYVLGGRLLLQQCAVMQGDSGGPVLVVDDGEVAVAGVLSGVLRDATALVSGSVPVAVFADALRQELGDQANLPDIAPLPDVPAPEALPALPVSGSEPPPPKPAPPIPVYPVPPTGR